MVENAGSGYTAEPIVTIVGVGTGATARAIIDFDLGTVIRIDIIKNGSGYYTTPTVVINGSNTTPATAYAMLKNNQVRSFDTTMKFDRISYTSSVKEWAANTYYTAGDIITHIGTLAGAKRQAFTVDANITTGSTFISNDYTIYNASNFTNANDRIIGYYEPSNTMPARDLKQLLRGIDYPGAQVQGLGFDQSPGFSGATPFDNSLFDNIQYDADGLPMLDDATIDTIIQSNYTDLALGTRPEDIDVVGGAYVDTYSSHAPEEMVPGIVFDTLDLRVFTKINGGADITGYRMFSNMMREESYIRIADAHFTLLAVDLAITDTEIVVGDASTLSVPNIAGAVPGVIFMNNERITYWTIDLVTNTLGQIRRGTQGTGTRLVHPADSMIIDASASQVIPNIAANISNTVSTGTSYTVTDKLSYYLDLSGSITASVGDVITQSVLGANVVVSSISTSTNIVLVTMNTTNPFRYLENDVHLSGNVTVVTGDIITQGNISTGANLYVTRDSATINTIAVSYNSMAKLVIGAGNIAINGVDAGVYPVTITTNPAAGSALLINGISTGNVYPMSITLAGLADINGNVTVAANVILTTANVWTNAGITTATDGTGFNGATTEQVLFLKASLAGLCSIYPYY